MAGEDFTRCLAEYPLAFYWMECVKEGIEKSKPLHNPEFKFNEDALEIGTSTMGDVTISALEVLKNYGQRDTITNALTLMKPRCRRLWMSSYALHSI